jgi:hypothetical protein
VVIGVYDGETVNGGRVFDDVAAARTLRCTKCGTEVDACTVCRTGFLPEHVVRCRGEGAHDHAPCATTKRRNPLYERRPTPPPVSTKRRK